MKFKVTTLVALCVSQITFTATTFDLYLKNDTDKMVVFEIENCLQYAGQGYGSTNLIREIEAGQIRGVPKLPACEEQGYHIIARVPKSIRGAGMEAALSIDTKNIQDKSTIVVTITADALTGDLKLNNSAVIQKRKSRFLKHLLGGRKETSN